MINNCIDNNEPFGVVLIKQGREALGPAATPHPVGCTAAISEVQQLPLGRMNITAVGQRRFRIKGIDRSQPFLLGDVEFFKPADDHPELIHRYSRLLRPLVIHYLETLSSSEDANFDREQIPHRARSIAHIASILLQADSAQKQQLLAMPSLSRLLRMLVESTAWRPCCCKFVCLRLARNSTLVPSPAIEAIRAAESMADNFLPIHVYLAVLTCQIRRQG